MSTGSESLPLVPDHHVSAAVVGLVGILVLIARRLPVGDGRSLTSREAILAGVVLAGSALVSWLLSPGYQAMVQARNDREQKRLTEHQREVKLAQLDKDLKQVGEDRKEALKDRHAKEEMLMVEALGGRYDPKTRVQLMVQLKGKRKEAYDKCRHEGRSATASRNGPGNSREEE